MQEVKKVKIKTELVKELSEPEILLRYPVENHEIEKIKASLFSIDQRITVAYAQGKKNNTCAKYFLCGVSESKGVYLYAG